MKPITPNEIKVMRRDFPPDVFEVFNRAIQENFINGYAVVKQRYIVDLLTQEGFTEDEIFRKNYLDIEDHYRDAGWEVEYYKPAYNEPGTATFTFRIKQG